jgi:hypothetical protein
VIGERAEVRRVVRELQRQPARPLTRAPVELREVLQHAARAVEAPDARHRRVADARAGLQDFAERRLELGAAERAALRQRQQRRRRRLLLRFLSALALHLRDHGPEHQERRPRHEVERARLEPRGDQRVVVLVAEHHQRRALGQRQHLGGRQVRVGEHEGEALGGHCGLRAGQVGARQRGHACAHRGHVGRRAADQQHFHR